jgi:tripartite-type tricarboxylate transporter receptor subunit TctC
MLAGINMLHVPYRGDLPAITDLISNQVQVYFSTLPAAIEYIRTRKLRALAVTTTKRSQALPDIPTMDDMLPGFDVSIWVGLVAPKNTPDEVVRNISRAVDSALVDPKIKARFAELGLTELHGSSADFGKFIVEETAKYGKVVKFAGIKPE